MVEEDEGADGREGFPESTSDLINTMKMQVLLTAVALVGAAMPVLADKTHIEHVAFAKGKSSTVISGKVSGGDTALYRVHAKAGQYLRLSLVPDKESADFNVYVPGRGPGDEAWFASATAEEGRKFTGKVEKTGEQTVTVFLNRAAGRKGATANFKLHVGVTDKHPGEHAEEKPAGGEVPQKVVDDCLAVLRKQIGDKKMKVISKKRGEASFVVDVQAEGVEKPWRCFHDGSKCTGTEYQGEG
jgi:hypothetical protein